MSSDFKDFIAKGNVLDLAVAVVIGGAFGKIVTALVEGVIMPLVGMAVPGGDWRMIVAGPFKVGSVLGATVDFLCIALVVFLVFVKGLGSLKKKEAPAAAPETKTCPACLEEIPKAATRCKHCTSQV
ncbi:MAG: large conductance mechanosensitive channel protein MscL [Holophagaceae bacterium]|nr:large conductance mechanosensitive channel protein MscL [Holophagaceae bacterium]